MRSSPGSEQVVNHGGQVNRGQTGRTTLNRVPLWLTRDEAAEVRDAMNDLLTEGDADWHAQFTI